MRDLFVHLSMKKNYCQKNINNVVTIIIKSSHLSVTGIDLKRLIYNCDMKISFNFRFTLGGVFDYYSCFQTILCLFPRLCDPNQNRPEEGQK